MCNNTAATGIRPYGPGKFSTMLDAYVYEVSLDGGDEEVGEADTTGWYGLLNGPIPYDPTTHALTEEEASELSKAQGAILFVNSSGFVDVTYYSDKSDLLEAWHQITDEVN